MYRVKYVIATRLPPSGFNKSSCTALSDIIVFHTSGPFAEDHLCIMRRDISMLIHHKIPSVVTWQCCIGAAPLGILGSGHQTASDLFTATFPSSITSRSADCVLGFTQLLSARNTAHHSTENFLVHKLLRYIESRISQQSTSESTYSVIGT